MNPNPKEESMVPVDITLHQASNQLELIYASGERLMVPVEIMRVFSPSAEVQGHGPGQETVQTGKRNVKIVALEPVGSYALQPTFSDGHDSGLFTWALLAQMGRNTAQFWSRYEDQLKRSGKGRDDPMGAVSTQGGSCSSH